MGPKKPESVSKAAAKMNHNRVGFQINLTIEEKDLIKTAADREGLPIATYIRAKALAAAGVGALPIDPRLESVG